MASQRFYGGDYTEHIVESCGVLLHEFDLRQWRYSIGSQRPVVFIGLQATGASGLSLISAADNRMSE
jgi:hypothetical protein